jgi:hypothetical protein
VAVCVWFLVFLLFIGPALGAVPGFGEPVVTQEKFNDNVGRGVSSICSTRREVS